MTKTPSPAPQLRGPSDHDVRNQIVEAATEYFGHYGYEKTTVSDLAKAIGFSKAYIYKFFDSKQAIGEVICANRLSTIMAAIDEAVAGSPSAPEQLRRTFRTLVEAGSQLFFQDRKLYEIAKTSAGEAWPSARGYEEHMRGVVLQIVRNGRESGEFERKTPLDETANAIFLVMRPYINPLLLQHNLDNADEATTQLSSLILRSLTP
ncbi:TPA: TetR/AcrR family transcriptional regulator [Pseudomonas aeruginosa]|uniref:TetR/AcrR family transcriptional regulator n=1 Tax=Pseudomonas aeruginosa TaxID=287 RepID=UPI0003B96221|nr:TetR/AcrR family transcriptional regulator [Pseudomonas aeruginosa]ERW07679.1 transcriptional regulator [Pseudomonas aeruginosa BWHPSA025]KSJ80890.1 TetR family transcriptional regulator [Pseudomonas aeruginosa]MCS7934133.1 TetR/AcrR family transcriptional regulator [Pseudomonas aeruginosa]MCS8281617.1 TetR/AcrR family transcriptional regulator [Pseudomonas aeruginosa]OWJ50934.1 TetR family transcriptional regulator [Pseudomonas aeruginosa]